MVNEGERKQIDLILSFEARKCLEELHSRLKSMYAEHSSRGLLRSGATVTRSVATMRELIEAKLADWAQKIGAISKEIEAHSAIVTACKHLLDSFANKLPEAIKVAGFAGETKTTSAGIQRRAHEIFAELRTDIDAKLEILAFSFQVQAESNMKAVGADENANHKPTKLQSGSALMLDSPNQYPEGIVFVYEEDAATAPTSPVVVTQEKRGRPPAKWWDEMWVAIAIQLYTGDLQPKKQADIEKAMLDWVASRGESAAPDTIRVRARKLWNALELENEK